MNRQIKIGLKVKLTDTIKKTDPESVWINYIGKPFIVMEFDNKHIILKSPPKAPRNPTVNHSEFWEYFCLFDEQLELEF
jgi:hypothetical protein